MTQCQNSGATHIMKGGYKVLERRALITAIGDRVNRMIPPLTVTKKEVDQLIRIMKASILEAAEEYQGMKMAG